MIQLIGGIGKAQMKDRYRQQPVIILAGGQSERMGRDKAELTVNGQRLIDHVVDRLADQSLTVMISGTEDYGTGLAVIEDRSDGPRGPAAALWAVSRTLTRQNVWGFFTCPVDGPNVPKDLTERLYDPDRSKVAVSAGQTHPTFAWWRLLDLVKAFDDIDIDRSISLMRIADKTQAETVSWRDPKLFLNLNTPDDVIAYEALSQHGPY